MKHLRKRLIEVVFPWLENRPELKRTLMCSALFQLAWFCCILAQTWVWVLYTIVYLVLYAVFISSLRYDFIFAFIVAGMGCSIDFLLNIIGVLNFGNSYLPAWLMTLWFLFALSMPYAFSFLRRRYILAACIGGVGASTSYAAAISLRADVGLMDPALQALIIIAVYWAALLPAALYLYEFFIRKSQRETALMTKL